MKHATLAETDDAETRIATAVAVSDHTDGNTCIDARIDTPVGVRGASSKRDVTDQDLHDTLVAFYATVGDDALLAPYFAVVDMQAHMPRIVAFWSTLLFHTRRYTGNAFRPHLEMPGLTADHFARWVATMEMTIDERFAGPNATLMKELAHRIAYSMQLRLGIPPFAAYREDQI